MNNFNRGNNKFGGSRDFKRPSFGGRRNSSDRPEMHDAVCGKCGKNCQVPFRPTGAKPVYCSDCFERNTDSAPRRFEGGNRDQRFDRRDSGRDFVKREDYGNKKPDDQYRKQFEALNWKLDKILKLLAPIEVPQEKIYPELKKVEKVAKTSKPKSVVTKKSSETKKAKNATSIEEIIVEE